MAHLVIGRFEEVPAHSSHSYSRRRERKPKGALGKERKKEKKKKFERDWRLQHSVLYVPCTGGSWKLVETPIDLLAPPRPDIFFEREGTAGDCVPTTSGAFRPCLRSTGPCT
jgi:hypothetical protein